MQKRQTWICDKTIVLVENVKIHVLWILDFNTKKMVGCHVTDELIEMNLGNVFEDAIDCYGIPDCIFMDQAYGFALSILARDKMPARTTMVINSNATYIENEIARIRKLLMDGTKYYLNILEWKSQDPIHRSAMIIDYIEFLLDEIMNIEP